MAAAARSILQRLDPELPARFRTLGRCCPPRSARAGFNVILIGVLRVAALVLATTGVFGVIGLFGQPPHARDRRACRARCGSFDLRLMIVRQGLWTILPGVAIGIAASLALTRTLESLLFGVTPTDPLTLRA